MPDRGNDRFVGAGGFHPAGTHLGNLKTRNPPTFRGWTTIFRIFVYLPPRGGGQYAVPVNGPGALGGSPKDFNDMRRQARPTEYGSRGRRFQR